MTPQEWDRLATSTTFRNQPEKPNQWYRLFSALMIHGGVLQILLVALVRALGWRWWALTYAAFDAVHVVIGMQRCAWFLAGEHGIAAVAGTTGAMRRCLRCHADVGDCPW